MHNVTLPTPDTFPDLLLTLAALSGEFPSALVKRLPGSEYYNRNAVTRMKKAGLLYKYSRDGLHGLLLTSAAKDLLLTQQPDRYSDILAGDSVLNAPKYTAVRRIRLHRMAEVLVSMFNANVLVLPWEKPDIFQEDGETSLIDIDQPPTIPRWRSRAVETRAGNLPAPGPRAFCSLTTTYTSPSTPGRRK